MLYRFSVFLELLGTDEENGYKKITDQIDTALKGEEIYDRKVTFPFVAGDFYTLQYCILHKERKHYLTIAKCLKPFLKNCIFASIMDFDGITFHKLEFRGGHEVNEFKFTPEEMIFMYPSELKQILEKYFTDKNLVDEILYDVAKNASGMYNMSYMSLLYGINGKE